MSKKANESIFTTSYKIQHIATLFADPCRFKADLISFTGSYTPEEISGLAGRGRFHFASFSLTLYDLDIEFPDRGTAEVTLTATLIGETKNGEYVNATHELETILMTIIRGFSANVRWLRSYKNRTTSSRFS